MFVRFCKFGYSILCHTYFLCPTDRARQILLASMAVFATLSHAASIRALALQLLKGSKLSKIARHQLVSCQVPIRMLTLPEGHVSQPSVAATAATAASSQHSMQAVDTLESLFDDIYREDDVDQVENCSDGSLVSSAAASRNAAVGLEYRTLFAPRHYDPGQCDVRTPLLPRVVRSLDLCASDSFVDLGSAAGRLALACALLPALVAGGGGGGLVRPSRIAGVEISPTRVACARRALHRLPHACAARGIPWVSPLSLHIAPPPSVSPRAHVDAHDRPISDTSLDDSISFALGDVGDVVPVGSVYFFGVKLPHDAAHAIALIERSVAAIRRAHRAAAYPLGAQCRVVCAGFALPDSLLGAARLVHATCFPVGGGGSGSGSGSSDIKSTSTTDGGDTAAASAAHSDNRGSDEVSSAIGKNGGADDAELLSAFETLYGERMGSRLLLTFELDLRVE